MHFTHALALLAQQSQQVEPPPSQSTWAAALDRLYGIGEQFVLMTPNILVGLVVFGIFYLMGRVIRTIAQRVVRRRVFGWGAALVIGRLVQGVTFIIGLLVAAVITFPTFTPGALIQFLGISSVAIGFAFRDVLQNYLAGVLLLITQPFRIGDQIVFGNIEGTVDDIQTRATYIRTYDNRRVLVPNSQLFTQAVIVNTAFEKRRLEYDVGIGYGDDIDRARELILEVMRQEQTVLSDPAPEVLTYELRESTVNLRVRWWISPVAQQDALDARDHVLAMVKKHLQTHGIDLAFPTQVVLFHDQSDVGDGDRKSQREGWPVGEGEPPRPRTIAGALHALVDRLDRLDGSRHKENDREPGKSEPASDKIPKK